VSAVRGSRLAPGLTTAPGLLSPPTGEHPRRALSGSLVLPPPARRLGSPAQASATKARFVLPWTLAPGSRSRVASSRWRHGKAAYDLGLIAHFRKVDYRMRRATAAAATPATGARSATVKGMTAPMKRILTAASFAALLGCAHFGKKEDQAEAAETAALQKQVQAQQAQINDLKSQQASPLQTQINELKSQIGMLQTQLIGLQTQSNGAATSKLAPALAPPAAGPALAPPPAGTPAYASPAAAPAAATPR